MSGFPQFDAGEHRLSPVGPIALEDTNWNELAGCGLSPPVVVLESTSVIV